MSPPDELNLFGLPAPVEPVGEEREPVVNEEEQFVADTNDLDMEAPGEVVLETLAPHQSTLFDLDGLTVERADAAVEAADDANKVSYRHYLTAYQTAVIKQMNFKFKPGDYESFNARLGAVVKARRLESYEDAMLFLLDFFERGNGANRAA